MGLRRWLSARADRKRDEKDPTGAPFRQEIRAKEAWFLEEVCKRGLALWDDPRLRIVRHDWQRVLVPREELETILAAIDAYEQQAHKRAAELERRFNESKSAILRNSAD